MIRATISLATAAWQYVSGGHARECQRLRNEVEALDRRRLADGAVIDRMVGERAAERKKEDRLLDQLREAGIRVRDLDDQVNVQSKNLDVAARESADLARRLASANLQLSANRDRLVALEQSRDGFRKAYEGLQAATKEAHTDWLKRIADVTLKAEAMEEKVLTHEATIRRLESDNKAVRKLRDTTAVQLNAQVEHLKRSLTMTEGRATEQALEIVRQRDAIQKATDVQDRMRETLTAVATEREGFRYELIAALCNLVGVWEAIHGRSVSSGWHARVKELEAGSKVQFEEFFGQQVPADNPVAWKLVDTTPTVPLTITMAAGATCNAVEVRDSLGNVLEQRPGPADAERPE